MNLLFFQAATGAYLVAAAGYISYIFRPDKKWASSVSLWATVAGFLCHLAYFSVRWSEAGKIGKMTEKTRNGRP